VYLTKQKIFHKYILIEKEFPIYLTHYCIRLEKKNLIKKM